MAQRSGLKSPRVYHGEPEIYKQTLDLGEGKTWTTRSMKPFPGTGHEYVGPNPSTAGAGRGVDAGEHGKSWEEHFGKAKR